MKPTHKTVYTMDIKRHNMCCWFIGNCRDEHWCSAVKVTIAAKARHSIKSRQSSHEQPT